MRDNHVQIEQVIALILRSHLRLQSVLTEPDTRRVNANRLHKGQWCIPTARPYLLTVQIEVGVGNVNKSLMKTLYHRREIFAPLVHGEHAHHEPVTRDMQALTQVAALFVRQTVEL